MFGSYDVIYAWLARQFPTQPAMRMGPAAE
jgi:hypothetical protein